jgi:hypothetical protein
LKNSYDHKDEKKGGVVVRELWVGRERAGEGGEPGILQVLSSHPLARNIPIAKRVADLCSA